ncbi:MAG: hypothetical protein AB1696_19755 [Planctomycetota bacterium]
MSMFNPTEIKYRADGPMVECCGLQLVYVDGCGGSYGGYHSTCKVSCPICGRYYLVCFGKPTNHYEPIWLDRDGSIVLPSSREVDLFRDPYLPFKTIVPPRDTAAYRDKIENLQKQMGRKVVFVETPYEKSERKIAEESADYARKLLNKRKWWKFWNWGK